jgi:hypothetical protein
MLWFIICWAQATILFSFSVCLTIFPMLPSWLQDKLWCYDDLFIHNMCSN